MSGQGEKPNTIIPVSDAGVIVIPPSDNTAQVEALAQIQARLESAETRITQGIEGERTWTTSQIAALTQELADCKATLQTMGQNLPEQVTELRAELTRLSQELQQVQTLPQPLPIPPETVIVAPIIAPPAHPPKVKADPENEGAPVVPQPPQGRKSGARRRVT